MFQGNILKIISYFMIILVTDCKNRTFFERGEVGMVTSPYKWKILKWDVKPQTYKQTIHLQRIILQDMIYDVCRGPNIKSKSMS